MYKGIGKSGSCIRRVLTLWACQPSRKEIVEKKMLSESRERLRRGEVLDLTAREGA